MHDESVTSAVTQITYMLLGNGMHVTPEVTLAHTGPPLTGPTTALIQVFQTPPVTPEVTLAHTGLGKKSNAMMSATFWPWRRPVSSRWCKVGCVIVLWGRLRYLGVGLVGWSASDQQTG